MSRDEFIPDQVASPVFAPESATREAMKVAVKCDWPWWWSRDQERYSGPCSTRTEAICEALSEDHFGSVHIMQALHGELRCRVFDGSEIAEAFDNANEEAADGDSDPLSTQVPDATWAKIAKSVEAQVKTAVYANGVSAWGFSAQSAGEWVELSNPHLAALPAEVRQILVEASLSFQGGWSSYYIDQLISRLKIIATPPADGPLEGQDGPVSSPGMNPENEARL